MTPSVGARAAVIRPHGRRVTLPTLRSPHGRRHALAIIAIGLALLASPAGAQSIQGRVLDRASGAPIPGVILSLVATGDAPIVAVLSDSQGRFRVQARRVGQYRLRADMIGHVTRVSEEIALADSSTVKFDFQFDRRTQSLPAINVIGTQRCATKPKAGVAAAALWEEIRKALDATRLADPGALMHVGLLQYERELDPATLAVRRSRSWMDAGIGQRPIGSLPAETLAAKGYVQASASGTWYYAPDAHTLLSETFLKAHCFQPRGPGEDNAGMVGLAFEPIGKKKGADVRGVLWLDQGTSELRFLEYSYTGMPRHLQDREYGGRLDFARLETGAWVVQRWSIRMPRVVRKTQYRQSPVLELGVSPRMSPVSEEVVAGIIERGGELARLAPAGTYGARSGIAFIRGEVFDSMSLRPLPGADIFVELTDVAGAGWRARTDSLGRFRIDSLSEGTYVLRAVHPRIDTLGASLPPMTVALAADEGVSVAFYTTRQQSAPAGSAGDEKSPPPAGETSSVASVPLSGGAPGAASPPGGSERVTGTVVGSSGRPIAGAEVRMPSSGANTKTSEDGRFVLVGLPSGRVDLEARALGHLPVRRIISIAPKTPHIANFRLVQIAQPLDTVAVVGRGDPYRTGVNERQRRAAGGHFLTRKMIDASVSRQVSELLRTVPGVRIRKIGSVSVVEFSGRGARTVSSRGCPVSWVLDGMPYEPASFGIDGEIGLDDVERIEVYDAATAPVQMSRFGASCGVVMLWSRERSVSR